MRGVSVLVLVACSGAAIKPRAPTLEVADHGAAPRVRLRYQPQVGDREIVEETIKNQVTASITNTVLETATQKADLPSVRVVGVYEPLAVAPNGDIQVRYSVSDVVVLDDAVDPQVLNIVRVEAPKLAGVRATWRQSALGEITDVVVEERGAATSRMLGNLRRGFEEPPVRFPEEEVGVGAVWSVTSQLRAAGVLWERRVTYRLIGMTDAAATIEAVGSMTAQPQAIAVEPNVTSKVSYARGTSQMQLVVPRHGLAATGDGKATEEIRVSKVSGKLRISETAITEATILIRPLAAEPKVGDPPSAGL